jgi:hypothetical protein
VGMSRFTKNLDSQGVNNVDCDLGNNAIYSCKLLTYFK